MADVADSARRGKEVYYAAESGDWHTLKALINARPKYDLNWPNPKKHNWTPFHVACRNNRLKCVQLLLDAGADADRDALADNGDTPLHRAASHGLLEVVRIMAGGGASLMILNKMGQNPAQVAHDKAHYDCARIIRGYAAFKAATDRDLTLLQIVIADCLNLYNFTSDSPLSFHNPLKHNWTPLHAACSGQDVSFDIVKMLLHAGADKDARADNGQTPLIRAARWGHPKVVQLLVDLGADLSVEDDKGSSAVQLASAKSQNDYKACIEIIEVGPRHKVAQKEAPSYMHNLNKAGSFEQVMSLMCAEPIASHSFDPDVLRLVHKEDGSKAAALLSTVVTKAAAIVRAGLLQKVALAAIKQKVDIQGLSKSDLTAQVKSVIAQKQTGRIAAETPQTDEFKMVIAPHLFECADSPLDTFLSRCEHIDAKLLKTAVAPEWLAPVLVDPAFELLKELKDAEVEMILQDSEMKRVYRDAVYQILMADRKIYAAAFDKARQKMPEKHDIVSELARNMALQYSTKGSGKVRLGHSGVPRDVSTVALKLHAAQDAPIFHKFLRDLQQATDVDLTIPPHVKKTARILEKKWLRGEILSVCDVSRALVDCDDFSDLLEALRYVQKSVDEGEIEIIDFKNRIAKPTPGGWSDIVVLIRMCKGNGHIHELQIALHEMLVARQGMNSHAAYSQARGKLEVLNKAGISVSFDDIADDTYEPSAAARKRDIKAIQQLKARVKEMKKSESGLRAKLKATEKKVAKISSEKLKLEKKLAKVTKSSKKRNAADDDKFGFE